MLEYLDENALATFWVTVVLGSIGGLALCWWVAKRIVAGSTTLMLMLLEEADAEMSSSQWERFKARLSLRGYDLDELDYERKEHQNVSREQ